LHPNCAAINRILSEAGAAGRVRILDQPAPTAAIAAALLGVEVGAIANSLVFGTAEKEPVLVLTSGAHRVDEARVAALLGTSTLRRATPDFVRAATGQAIGGVAPFGHPTPIRTLIDVDLSQYPEIWAAAGIPQSVFPISYHLLVELSNAEPTVVA
jgi:prolyl-tRNA editing enzyme YbaK/EbsC (Cys-tRNA(Pro) deacylase)